MTNPEAARIAEALRTAMKSQSLSGADVAQAVERLTGERPHPMRVSRWMSGTRPLIRISPDLRTVCQALGLDAVDVVCDAVRGVDLATAIAAFNVHQTSDCMHPDVAGQRCASCCDTCSRSGHLCAICAGPVGHDATRCPDCAGE